MAQFGFYFNQEDCIGCKTCQVACCDRNNTASGVAFRSVLTFEAGEYPNASMYHYSKSCNHCAKPACMAQCSTGAIRKEEDGTVIIDSTICNACGACVEACPYDVPVMQSDKEVVGKCDGCKPFRDAGQNPVCVDACPMRCIEFGDVEELRAKYGDGVDALPILPDPSRTEPSLLIAPKAVALDENYRLLII